MLLLGLCVLVLTMIVSALVLFLIIKGLGGTNVSYLKVLGVIIIWWLGSLVLAKFLFSLLAFLISLVLLCWLLKKFFGLSWGKTILAYFGQFMGVIIIAVILRFVVIAPFIEPVGLAGHSMEPTYNDGAYLLVNKIDKNYKRGDIVVYYPPGQTSEKIIHRIVGLPGETVHMANDGKVVINGKELKEDYIKTNTPEGITIVGQQVTLAPDEYYVLPDNRQDNLRDSRSFGGIKKASIIGKIWYAISND